jgi:hypothetical protein
MEDQQLFLTPGGWMGAAVSGAASFGATFSASSARAAITTKTLKCVEGRRRVATTRWGSSA